MYKLLIVEDEQAICTMLTHFFNGKGFAVEQANSAEQALDKLAEIPIDLIILDWMLPCLSGPQLTQKLRKTSAYQELPIIMLTAKAEEADKIKGLDTGADDYMTKPVSLKELYSRVKALLRRSQGLNSQHVIERGILHLNPANNQLSIHQQEIKIGSVEFKLLHYLMKKPDKLHSRKQLLDQVWGMTAFIEERTVDVHILRLRKILKPYDADYMIKTVRGLGYKLGI